MSNISRHHTSVLETVIDDLLLAQRKLTGGFSLSLTAFKFGVRCSVRRVGSFPRLTNVEAVAAPFPSRMYRDLFIIQRSSNFDDTRQHRKISQLKLFPKFAKRTQVYLQGRSQAKPIFHFPCRSYQHISTHTLSKIQTITSPPTPLLVPICFGP